MDDIDRRIMTVIQRKFPIDKKPFTLLSRTLRLSAIEILTRLERLHLSGHVGQVRPVFDPRKLGYRSTLVAMRLEKEKLEEALAVLCSHPAIAHVSTRSHPMNLWFYLALPPEESFQDHLEVLHRLTGSQETLMLPVVKSYCRHTQIRKDAGGQTRGVGFRLRQNHGHKPKRLLLSPREIQLMRYLQEGLDYVLRPYDEPARKIDLSERECVGIIRSFEERGFLKRMSASMPSPGQENSFSGNHTLFVLRVPEEIEDEVGERLSRIRHVEACYKRPFYPSLPFSFYLRFGPRETADRDALIRTIEAQAGSWPSACLPVECLYKSEEFLLYPDTMSAWLTENRSRVSEAYPEEAETPDERLKIHDYV